MNSLQLCSVLLLVLPWSFALLIYFSNRFFRYALTLVAVVSLAVISVVANLQSASEVHWSLSSSGSQLLLGLDYLILALFTWIGFYTKSWRIALLSIFQIVLLAWISGKLPHAGVQDFRVDRLASLMYLLINGVGGVVAFFALRYIEDEKTTQRRQSLFTALLVAFLGVMNFLVSVNNIEWFYLAFEATTLASFLLIGFRQDEISRKNAQTALWMNQIGGVSILLALALLTVNQNTIHFSTLSRMEGMFPLLPIAFLVIAALVKGAQLPFSGWLLGAMVAPTPVSAILHSSTMVKIAPYLLLRLAPLIAGTWLSFSTILLTGVVYILAGVMALSENNFKRVLAWSTVGLLGLMMLTAAIGTPQAMTAALALMLFHGVSKALLFLQAGVLEKVFHKKNIDEFGQLIRYAPITTFFINVGFLSIALPPFGAFVGKWLGLATASSGMGLLQLLLPILVMSFGSVVLSILYFKIMGVLAMKMEAHYRSSNSRAIELEKLPWVYLCSGFGLFGVLALAAIFIAPILANALVPAVNQLLGSQTVTPWLWADGLSIGLGFTTIYFWQILLAFLLVVTVPPVFYLLLLRNVDIVKEYACGEKFTSNFVMYSYSGGRKVERLHNRILALLFAVILLTGVIGQ